MSNDGTILAKGILKSFGPKTVLKDINLDIASGEICCKAARRATGPGLRGVTWGRIQFLGLVRSVFKSSARGARGPGSAGAPHRHFTTSTGGSNLPIVVEERVCVIRLGIAEPVRFIEASCVYVLAVYVDFD